MILAGDIGGTKTLLALFDGTACAFKARYESTLFTDFDGVLLQFLDDAGRALGSLPRIGSAGIGVAGPVSGDRVRLTNLPWEIDVRALSARLRLPNVRLLNDFAAVAHGIGVLAESDIVTLQRGVPVRGAPRLVIGAGTGLGVAYAVGSEIVSGEGGHTAFAPANETQAALWSWLRQRLGRVEAEHVVSGPGLVRIYEFLAERHPEWVDRQFEEVLASNEPARAISRRALQDGDALATAAVDLFLDCYGAVAGDHALALLAYSGVFVAGGIAPRLLPRLPQRFLGAFNDKGAFSTIASACPVHVIVNTEVGLLGAAQAARD
jgi:glucokinase